MLAFSDAIVLPIGVEIEGDAVADSVRGARYPLNTTALFVLERAGRPLDEVASELAHAHGVALGRARADILAFAGDLNRHLLANVERGERRLARVAAWIALAARLAPAGTLPRLPARRAALDTRTPLRAVLSVAAAARRRAVALGALAALLAAQLGVAGAGTTPVFTALAAAGVALGFLLHETGHAVALVGVRAALIVAGARTYVLHAAVTPRRRWAVALAGPGLAAFAGLVGVTAARALSVPDLALGACALAGHAVALTVAASDGRTACAC